MNDAKNDAKAIFLDALDCKDADELSSFLARACGTDAAARARVEELLRAHQDAGAFLGGAQTQDATRDQPVAERPGTIIGSYKLLQRIGEGGMGTVFMAEQTEPVRRKVALKLIKPGMDSRLVIARFEAERQALALMDHPNIAKVFDAGTTDSGRPYFVMELIKGLPITRYCDEHHLTPRQRLELFVPVCQAAQHAHQKGIIHRDLKPSNVMICLYDGQPVAKVIDFGIAKAAGPRLTEHTLFTQFGQVVGTFEYMSPEQAELNQLDIDTRTDIYSLGVLLYELLTGTTPLERKRLKEVAFLEVLRLIREEESPRPSTRLSKTDGLPSIAVNRGSEPKKLRGLLRGELDWIVMKALDKDRNRRYGTASALAADVERYLHDEPVSACPPSAWYRFGKLARRNKGTLVTAALVSLALVVGTAVSVWQAIRATEAMNSEEQTLVDLEMANGQLKNQQKATDRELRHALEAEDKATRELFDSLVSQARANRLSRRLGQRFRTLEILRKATGMAQQLKLPAERFLELRNEAIAALALPDLRVDKAWPDGPGGPASFDAAQERYARVDQNGKLHVRRAGDGKEIYHLADYGPGEHVPILSPDGGYVADFDPGRKRLSVWRLAGAEPAVVLDEAGLGAYCLCFSPNSRQLALQQADGSIGIFDLATSTKVHRLPPLPLVHHLRFHPNGDRLALVFQQRFAQVRDLQTGKVLWQKNLNDAWPYMDWHPDGKILALSEGEVINFWDVAKDKQVGKLERIQGGGLNFVFNANGNVLASSGWAGTLSLWDPLSNRQFLSTPFGGPELQFSAHGRFLTAREHDTKMRIWEIAAGHEYQTLVANPVKGMKGYQWVAISSEGRFLAAGATGGVGLWDLPSGKELAFLEPSPRDNSVALEPRSAHAASEEKSAGALLTMGMTGLSRWPIRTDQEGGTTAIGPAQKLPVPDAVYCQIALSRDGRVLAAAQYQGQGALVLHADQPDRLIKLGPQHDVRFVAVSPDGRSIATGSFSHPGGAKIWTRGPPGKLPAKGLTYTLVKDLPVGGHCRLAFSPDGKHLLTGGLAAPRTVRRWDVETGVEIPFTEPIEGQSPAYAPDGKLLVVEAGTGIARLVHAESGKEIARLEDPDQHRTNQFAFSPDGTKLACATGDGNCVHVWDLQAIRRQLADMGLDWK